ncbi:MULTISPECIES: hypothetical protein [Pseudomonas]|uniref:hypothetical protein n=1 Tax=Pseudomonas TaxID=286 RepID=UPI001CF05C67|nr:hypothetical protein [Pseudomonas sp. HS-18]UCL88713.1 hypothetical protein LDJ84_08460 [Pseudomonas sp. HS-18]
MNIQLNQLQRLLAEIDSLMASAEATGLIREARHCAEKARSAAAKAIKIAAELDAQADQLPQAWRDVQAECLRQVDAEGWTHERDDNELTAELAQAGTAYMLHAFPRADFDRTYAARYWPWISGFRPEGDRMDLVRGVALGLVALEHHDRAAVLAQGDQE